MIFYPPTSPTGRLDDRRLIGFWNRIGTMRKNLFWLSNEQWAPIKPHLRTDVCRRREEGRLSVISGIVHALKRAAAVGAMARVEAHATIYNGFARWAQRRVWENLFRKLAGSTRSPDTRMIDSTRLRRSGRKGSRNSLLAASAADAARRFMHKC